MLIHPNRWKMVWVVGSIILVLGIAGFIIPGGLELRVTHLKSGRVLLVLPLKPGERFTIHYYHSVENAPIWEEHSVDKDGVIYIEEERYEKFGAGMGKMPGVGRMVRKGPYEAIVEMHMPVGEFILRVGSPGVDHTVIWRDYRENLSRSVPHEAVQFSARPVGYFYYLWRHLVPHPATPGIRDNNDDKDNSQRN